MSVTDSIADLLTRIRNANTANHESVDAPASKVNLEIVRILKDEGFIKDYETVKDAKFPTVRIYIKYGPKREKVITNLKRISKPGLRVYAGKDNLPRVLRGLGIAVVSTSKGIMTDREARRLGIGGEILCYIW